MPRLSYLYALVPLVHFINRAHAQFLPSTAPQTWREGQTGVNQCGTANSPASKCQNAYLNSGDDFCLWGPPQPGADATIGNMERVLVSWCTKNGTGTRTIPDGAIRGAHFVQTPDFVQVTGIGNLSMINIPWNDAGGELDPHGADGLGNPLGGLVFSSAFGQVEQIMEWTLFISFDQFCFRACKPGPNAVKWCQHIYDQMGCAWNMPGDYGAGFDSCKGDSGEPMGIYGTSTFYQGAQQTPIAHPRPSVSSCVAQGSDAVINANAPTASLSNAVNPPSTVTGTNAHTSGTSKGPASSSISGASGPSGAQHPVATSTGAAVPPGGHPAPNTTNPHMSGVNGAASTLYLYRQADSIFVLVLMLASVVGIVMGGLVV